MLARVGYVSPSNIDANVSFGMFLNFDRISHKNYSIIKRFIINLLLLHNNKQRINE